MADFTLSVQERSDSGSRACRALRRRGEVPGVIYHRGEESVAVALGLKEFTYLAKQAKPSQVFTLKSESPRINGRPALVRQIARDSVKGEVLHVDLQAMREDEEVSLAVPVRIVGEAPGVKIDKGILSLLVHEVTVSCLPKSIPAEVLVDVTQLGLGQSIHARDLALGEGVKLGDDPEETIVTVVAAGAAEAAAEAPSAAAPAKGAATAKSAAAPAKAAPAKSGKGGK